MARHRALTWEQVAYNPTTDRAVSFEDGLDYWTSDGWELVTSYPSHGYAPGCTTIFIFRKNKK
jgi:hypothetical protein